MRQVQKISTCDVKKYQHFKFLCRDESLELLNTNRRASNDLVADVLDQSADNLIDGVTSGKINFQKI